jgi:hypothetical protein
MAKPDDERMMELLEAFWQNKQSQLRHLIESIANEKMDAEVRKSKRHAAINRNLPKLNNFTQEEYQYIANSLESYCKGTSDLTVVLQKIIRDLYFNPNIKRNNNVFIPRNALNYACIFKDNTWGTYPLSFCLEAMVRRGNDVLETYIVGCDEAAQKQFATAVGKKRYESIKEFTEKINDLDTYQNLKEQLLKDTENTIMTFQHTVHNLDLNT